MAKGRYDIQLLMPGDRWKTSLRMQMMGRDFARGAFFALKEFNGGGLTYRLVHRGPAGAVQELDRYSTGHVVLNEGEKTMETSVDTN